MNKLISPALPLALALSTFYMVANAADWPRWRGPDADGISNEDGWLAKWPQEGPKRLWKTSVGTGFSSVAVGKGKVYTMGNDGKSTDTIYCLDAGTGKAIWTRQYDAPLDPNMYEGGPNATPTLDGDRVYTLGKRGQVFCLNATNGEVIWNKDLMKDWGQEPPTWGFAGSPAVDGGLVLLNSGGAGLALKKDTGEEAWKSGGKKPGYSTPLAVDWKGKRTVFLMTARALAGVRESDGSVLWSYPWKTSYDMNIADPIL